MATVAQIRTAIENWLAANGPKLVRRQNKYFAAKGRYWQGIITPGTPPDDGASVVADYTRKPTDQAEKWSDIFVSDGDGDDTLPVALPLQISVDVYDGPAGKGWTGTLRGTKAGTLYSRTWNFGPETQRETGWVSSPWPPVTL